MPVNPPPCPTARPAGVSKIPKPQPYRGEFISGYARHIFSSVSFETSLPERSATSNARRS